jgi:uncharacterized membrane protein
MRQVSLIIHLQAFLTTYDAKAGVEMFETQYRSILKLLAKLLNVWILTVLSTRCFHQWRGAKMMLSYKTQEKALEIAKRRYAQGALKSLQEYLQRWRAWAHAGLPSQAHSVDNIIRSLFDKVTLSRDKWKFTEITKPAKYL